VALAGFENIERRHFFITGARATATSVGVLAVYFLVPIAHRPHERIFLRLAVSIAFFTAVLIVEVRSILRSRHAMLRAADAMVLVLPLFVVLFAWTYLTLARSTPGSFSQGLSRVKALYFTVTVFTTVGFGDVVPTTDPARLVVTAQMVLDVIVIAAVVRLILEAARGTFGRSNGDEPSSSE